MLITANNIIRQVFNIEKGTLVDYPHLSWLHHGRDWGDHSGDSAVELQRVEEALVWKTDY